MTETQDTGHAAEDGGVTPGLLAQLSNTLWLPHQLDEATRAARRAAARAMLADIDPAPGIESMLACQMVAAHETAMACLSRSAAPDQSPEQTDQNLKHAERLMAIYTRQVDVLDRHRIRELELRIRLGNRRRNEEWRAELESMRAQRENDSDCDDGDEDEDQDDGYATIEFYTRDDTDADGAGGNGAGKLRHVPVLRNP